MSKDQRFDLALGMEFLNSGHIDHSIVFQFILSCMGLFFRIADLAQLSFPHVRIVDI